MNLLAVLAQLVTSGVPSSMNASNPPGVPEIKSVFNFFNRM
jgi:hypothetical protein